MTFRERADRSGVHTRFSKYVPKIASIIVIPKTSIAADYTHIGRGAPMAYGAVADALHSADQARP
jgi:hypothetical protein